MAAAGFRANIASDQPSPISATRNRLPVHLFPLKALLQANSMICGHFEARKLWRTGGQPGLPDPPGNPPLPPDLDDPPKPIEEPPRPMPVPPVEPPPIPIQHSRG
jgi:hypothetical protein